MKLSKAQQRQQAEHAAQLAARAADVGAELRRLLGSLPELARPVNAAIERWNAAALAANAFAAEVADQLDGDINEKSERWQEGDAGQAAQALRDEWQEFDAPKLGEIWLLEPELDDDPNEAAKELAELPQESDQ